MRSNGIHTEATMTKSVVTVKIEKKEGWYMATSPDLKGLLVGHPNYVEFVNEIPKVIKALFKAQYGKEVQVEELSSRSDNDPTRVVFEAIAA